MATQKQIEANRRNAQKAGRKKGVATIEREKIKEYIATRISENVEPIIDALLAQAISGDVMAIRELFDRGIGRPVQSVNLSDEEGKSIFNNETRDKTKKVIGEALGDN